MITIVFKDGSTKLFDNSTARIEKGCVFTDVRVLSEDEKEEKEMFSTKDSEMIAIIDHEDGRVYEV